MPDGRAGLARDPLDQRAAVRVRVHGDHPVAAQVGEHRAQRGGGRGLADAALEADHRDPVAADDRRAGPLDQVGAAAVGRRQAEVDPAAGRRASTRLRQPLCGRGLLLRRIVAAVSVSAWFCALPSGTGGMSKVGGISAAVRSIARTAGTGGAGTGGVGLRRRVHLRGVHRLGRRLRRGRVPRRLHRVDGLRVRRARAPAACGPVRSTTNDSVEGPRSYAGTRAGLVDIVLGDLVDQPGRLRRVVPAVIEVGLGGEEAMAPLG